MKTQLLILDGPPQTNIHNAGARRLNTCLFVICLLLLVQVSKAQLGVAALNTQYTIDFNSTVTNVHTGTGIQSGFVAANVTNYLNSNAWSTTGWSGGDMAFGTTAIGTSSPKWRGSTGGNAVTTGGCYAFFIVTGNYALGVQPTGDNFAPGSIILKMNNSSGDDVDSIHITYDLYVRNDQNRANSFNFSHSSDNSSYNTVPALDYTSVETGVSGAALTPVPMAATFSVSWANGTTYYIRWMGDDVSGSGSRDEFAIDNIVVTALQASAVPNSIAITSLSQSAFCVDGTMGDSVYVDFSATGTYNSGNVYTAEISDDSGSFASATAIGTLAATATSGTIGAFIPAGTAAGSGYRIRVTASDSATTGTDNGSDLVIGTLPAAAFAATDITCNGAADGMIDLSVTNGTAPYAYNWTGGAATEDINGLVAGSYTVTVTDSLGCGTTDSTIISEPAQLAITDSIDSVSCHSAGDGAIYLEVTGGTVAYSFTWSNGAATEDIANLTAGTYTVTVTDANGCTDSSTIVVSEPAVLSLSSMVTDAACNGSANGLIDLAVSGGTTPYSYNWTGSLSTEDLNGLAAGSYSVTVTDANNCTASGSYPVSEPAAISASASTNSASCGGFDGAIDMSVTGGAGAYTYQWSDSATSEDLSGLAVGTYTVTVTDTTGCQETFSFNVNSTSPLTASASLTHVTCNGGADGAVDITASGGTTPYTYLWSGGATTEDIASLTAGTYTVTVTDSTNCQFIATHVIGQPAVVGGMIAVTNASCNGSADGGLDLTPSGGTAPYTFSWSATSTQEDLSALAAGSYTVTITDSNSCTGTATATVSEPAVLALNATLTNVSCNGAANGAVNLTVAGGTSSYSYNWTGGATAQDLTGLIAGTYTVTVTDANNCTDTASFTLSEPAVLTLSDSITDAACNGAANGVIDLSITGGTSAYAYNWAGGASTEDRTGLAANTYTVTVTDANGCTASASFTVGEPATLGLTASATDATCNGAADGSIDLTVTGGTAAYSYNWTGGLTVEDPGNLAAGTYTVTVTDANSCTAIASYTVGEPSALSLTTGVTDALCNGSATGAIDLTAAGGTAPYTYNWTGSLTTEDLGSLVAGTYTVTVTDANGCTATSAAAVAEPAAVALTSTVSDALCNGSADGTIDLGVSGGTTPYTYNWTGNTTTEDLNGLAAGTYTVTVTDSNGCTATSSATVGEPTVLSLSATVADALCNGSTDGAIDLGVAGGTASYAYNWTGSLTTEDLSGLTAGTYSVTVTDANGCTDTASYTVNEPIPLDLTVAILDATCNSVADGEIDLTVTGGTASYTFSWTGGITSEDLVGTAANTYTVTVADANGCTATASYTISEPTAIVVTSTSTDITCPEGADGAIDLTVSGGVAPYAYLWSGSETTEDVAGLTAGMHNVTVADAHNCALEESFILSQPASFVIVADIGHVSCSGLADGEADITVTGGTAPYTYEWSTGETAEDASGLTAGSYTVTVTDDEGCEFIPAAVDVTEPDELIILLEATNITCEGCFGEVNATVQGGTAPYSYNWSSGHTTEDITEVDEAGTYTLTVTDANGCEAESTDTVSNTVGIAGRAQVSAHIDIFPNPSTDRFTMVLRGTGTNAGETMKLQVFDLCGKLVMETSQLPATQQVLQIDASTWSSGIFLYRVSAGDEVVSTGRLTKQ